MELDYPGTIPYRGERFGEIKYRLLPEDTGRNVLFLPAGGDSITVYPDGTFKVNGTGITTIHVIPTENTAIYRTIQIMVMVAAIRRVSTTALRITGNGNFRLS
jgi:hypothetical protein